MNDLGSQTGSIGAVIEATVEKLTYGGDGLARFRNRVCFVPDALPGASVKIRIDSVHKKFLRGTILQVLEPGPGQRIPPCCYAQDCGGCQLQALTYPAQQAAKSVMLNDLFKVLTQRFPIEILPLIQSPAEFEYRSHTTLQVDSCQTATTLGFYRRRSQSLIAIDQCRIVPRLVSNWFSALQEAVRGLKLNSLRIAAEQGENRLIIELTGDDGQRSKVVACLNSLAKEHDAIKGICFRSDAERYAVGNPVCEFAALGFRFRLGASDFSQSNLLMYETLLETALALLVPEPNNTLLDLYCGIGFFTVPLAAKVRKGVGVEASRSAVSWARDNAARARIRNVKFVSQSVEDFIRRDEGTYDLVVLDPPRSGCRLVALEWLIKRKPAKILYVSCNPSTLVRDLEVLLLGGYALKTVQPLDLFPQTYHIECMALLHWQGKGSHGISQTDTW